MSKLNKFIIAIFAVMFFAGSTAMAGPISIGVTGNFATFDTTGEETETQCSATGASCFMEDPNVGTASNDADFPAFFIEYNTNPGNSGLGMTFGFSMVPGEAEIGSKARTDTQSDTNEDSNDSGTYTGKAEVSDLMTLYVEPTYMITDSLGLYGTAGVSQVEILTLDSIALGTDSSQYGNETVYGAMAGLGIKALHSSGVFFKLSGAKTWFDEVSIQSNSGNKNKITAKPQMENIALSVGYNF